MEMILPVELVELFDVDDAVARRLIATARSIAPCLDTLVDEPRLDAIAILRGVAAELPTAGTGRMKSQSRNGTSVSWADFSTAFTPDYRSALRALCGSFGSAGAPAGSFPESTVACDIWPAEVVP